MKSPTLYLIPTTLGNTPTNKVLPKHNTDIINNLSVFIVENLRSARRFLKKCNPDIDINSLTFYELNKHTLTKDIPSFLNPMKSGESIGVISEAGCPAIADPGSDVVAIAQKNNHKVVPLVGPSSILMSLMASGFNGQSFTFLGYLPIALSEKTKSIKHMERKVYAKNQTQIFIETPYRNIKTFQDIITTCQVSTKLCIAYDLTLPTENIKTKSIKEWKKETPDIHKKPCIFLLYK